MKKVITLACLISLACSQAYADKLAVSEKSSVVIVLKHTPPGKDGKPPRTMTLSVEDSTIQNLPAPNGKVFDIPSRPGATFRFRIEEFNTLKYSTKETPTAVEEPKLTLPDIFSKALEGLVAKVEAKKALGQPVPVSDWEKTLRRFEVLAENVDLLRKAIKETDRLIKNEESYAGFLDSMDKYSKAVHFDDWYKPDNLARIIEDRKKAINEMVVLSIALKHYSEQDPANLTYEYAAREAAAVTEEAIEFQKHLDDMQKTVTAYVQDGNTKVFTYMSAKPTEFTSGKLSIKLEVFLRGDEKQESPIYRLDIEIAAEKKTFLDASAGVFFTNVRDETYNLRDKTSGEINPSASANNIIVRNGSRNSLGANFGAMLHYGYMTKPNVGAAFSLGLATGDNRYNFYLGGSLALSEKRRFYASGGYALASVKRLKGYNEGDRFTGAAGDIPTDFRYKSGYFFGVSYKF